MAAATRWVAGLVLALWLFAAPASAIHGSGDLLNCDDFAYQQDAQAHLNAHPNDPDTLDADNDNVACEELPIRPTGQAGTTTTTRPGFATTGGIASGKFALGAGLVAVGVLVFNRGLWTKANQHGSRRSETETTLMGWRFRKSRSLFGGLLRFTLGRRGVSTSVGRRGVRVSRAPDGKLRRTASLPGTGLSHSEDMGKRRRRRKRR